MLASTFALISAAFKVVLLVVVGVVRCCCLRRKGTVKRAPARGTTYFVTLSCLFFVKSLSSWAAKRAAVSSVCWEEHSAFLKRIILSFFCSWLCTVFNRSISCTSSTAGGAVSLCVKKFWNEFWQFSTIDQLYKTVKKPEKFPSLLNAWKRSLFT